MGADCRQIIRPVVLIVIFPAYEVPTAIWSVANKLDGTIATQSVIADNTHHGTMLMLRSAHSTIPAVSTTACISTSAPAVAQSFEMSSASL